MENIALPAKEAEILQQIKKKYRVAFNPLKIQTHELSILQVEDIEPLLAGQDPFKDVANFPFWVKIWEAAMVLANILATLKPSRPDERFLELGAGLGIPGMVAAACGYQVTLSDYEPLILDFQRVTAAANKLNAIDHRIIDWNNPPELPRFHTIVGAEILFREDFFEPLLRLFGKLLAPDGTIYLAHDGRRKSLAGFLEKAQEKYHIGTKKITLTSDEEQITVLVNRLKLKTNG